MNREKNKIAYPDFVAYSKQVNTPPGSYETIKQWINHAFIDHSSRILEIGCSMGFTSYQLNRYTGADVTGIDLSDESIRKARENCAGINGLEFLTGNAGNMPLKDESFSHVVISGHLPWVPEAERRKHIDEALRVLKEGGFLLTALYYFSSTPTARFVDEFNKEFNTSLKPGYDYDYWSSLFNLPSLDMEYESNFKINPPSKARKEEYLSVFNAQYRDSWKKKIKLFAENGKYLSFFVKVFRKEEDNAYRQRPRGGIYTWGKIDEKAF